MRAITVGAAMTTEVLTTTADASIHDASRPMAQHWIRHLPVVDGTEVVGMLSQRDVMGVFAALRREPGDVAIESDELVRLAGSCVSNRVTSTEHPTSAGQNAAGHNSAGHNSARQRSARESSAGQRPGRRNSAGRPPTRAPPGRPDSSGRELGRADSSGRDV